jgi:broad specificity phosphatase PhoE
MKPNLIDYDGPSIMEFSVSSELREFSRRLVLGPTEIIVIRHGFSEANFAQKERKKDPGAEAVKLMAGVSDTSVRLYDSIGRQQASKTGEWVAKNLGFLPDIGYTSDFARAQETAGIIGKAAGYSGEWRMDPLIGERSWGRLHELDSAQQSEELKLRDSHVRHWTPAHGESIKQIEAYVRDFLNSIWRKHPGQKVLLVTHGEFILAMQSVMEKFTPSQLQEAGDLGFPNCGVLHYSRRSPNGTPIELSESFDYVKKICPWDPNWKNGKLNGEWKEIIRPTFTNDELIQLAEEHPRRFVA